MTDDAAKLKTFCTEALTLLGVGVSEADHGQLSVAVPPSMLDLFEGRPSLRLGFGPEYIDDGVELVTPGSYVLERIIEAVRGRGELSSSMIDPVVRPSAAPGVKLANAEARLVSSQTVHRDLLLVNFRVSLVSDENQDRMLRVLVDLETGKQADVRPSDVLKLSGRQCRLSEAATGETLDRGFAAAESAAMEHAREWAGSSQREIDARLAHETARLDQYYQDVLTDASGRGKSPEVRKLQRQRERAVAAHDEQDRAYLTAREMLENCDTVESLATSFNVRSKPLYQKRKRFAWSLNTDYAESARCNREIRILEKANEIARRVFDSHPPQARLAELENERQAVLAKLREKAEKREASLSDPAALAHLQDLGAHLDSEKAQRIAELQEKFHLKVVVVPVSAGVIRYPRSVCSYSAVSGSMSIPFISRQDLITGRLEGPGCQSCGGDMASGFACACGHLVCEACHKICAGCGKDLCSSCVTCACQVCGGAVCDSCRSACQACGKMTCPNHSVACKACGKAVCWGAEGSCAKTCAICGGGFCAEHIETCPACGSAVCAGDMRACAECGTRACRVDIADCPSCGKAICSDHGATCGLCGQRVCRGCVGPSGYCATCEGLFPASSSVPAIGQILGVDSGRGRWMVSESRDAFVLVRRGARLRVYSVDKANGRVVAKRSLGLIESLKAKLRLPPM